MQFDDKQTAREWVWETLREEGAARFPYPIEGRIPNFEGAQRAAEELFDALPGDQFEAIKVNPDSPQKYVRERALGRGIAVYVPTPRLKGGFMAFEPERIPEDSYRDASMLSRWDPWAETVPLEELPAFDLIVAGSVAVSPEGERCGKGEGYSDLEYAILRELGHDPTPVATTVHDIQLVDSLPTAPHDLGLSAIATPETTVEVDHPPAGPDGIDWALLDADDLQEMPILRRMREEG